MPSPLFVIRLRRVRGGVGVIAFFLAPGNVAIKFGGPGWAFMFAGPALKHYWQWRRQKNAIETTAASPA